MTLFKNPEEYRYHYYNLIDVYVTPEDPHRWLKCPVCKLRPKVWCFDNGKYAACGCHDTEYVHFSVKAESIISHYSRAKKFNLGAAFYRQDELRKNWNHFVQTGQHKFIQDYKSNQKW